VLPDMPDEPDEPEPIVPEEPVVPVLPERAPPDDEVPVDDVPDCATCALSFDAVGVALPAKAVLHKASADAARIICGRDSLLMCVSEE
jgi:hypothetical protein